MIGRLGIYRPGGIGDTFLLAAGLREVRRQRPDIHLHLWGSAEAGYVLHALDLVDSVMDQSKGLRLPPLGLDALLGFEDADSTGLSKVSRHLGVAETAVQRCFHPHGVHQSRYLWEGMRALLALDAQFDDATPFTLSPPYEWLGREWQGYAALYPGASSKQKRWPLAGFLGLAGEIERALGLPVVFIESPSDHFAVPQRYPVIQMPYIGLAWMLSRCALYVGNDTATTHLAGMMGTPTVALFGPTQPLCWRPIGPRVSYINHCAIMQRTSHVLFERHECLKDLAVEEVVRIAALRLQGDEYVYWPDGLGDLRHAG